MDFITAKEASERWNINVRVVQDYCKAGRIPDAIKHGTVWMIPSNAAKPQDPRKTKKASQATQPSRYQNLFLLQTLRFDGRSPEELAAELPSEKHREQFWLEYAFYRNETIHLPPNRTIDDPNNFFMMSHLLAHALLSIYNGNYPTFDRAMKLLDEVGQRYKDDPIQHANIELAKAAIHTGLYDMSFSPDWLKNADFSMFVADSKPFALYLFTRYLHVTGQIPHILGVAEAALAFAQGEGFTIPELYLMIGKAAVLLALGDKEKARAVLQKAIALVHPYRLYLPFLENITLLRGELDAVLKENYPDDYRYVMMSWKKIMAGWTIIHNKMLNDNVPLLLSLRELQIGLYLVDGLSYKEIAQKMDLSLSTVNNYIQNIRSKLGVNTKAEVIEYMRWA